MDSETKIYQIPEFTGGHIPVKEAARIMGKDYQFVRLGLIEGILTLAALGYTKIYEFGGINDWTGETVSE